LCLPVAAARRRKQTSLASGVGDVPGKAGAAAGSEAGAAAAGEAIREAGATCGWVDENAGREAGMADGWMKMGTA